MSLQVWLPLNGNLNNQGLSEVTITNNGATVSTSGKIGSCYLVDQNSSIFFSSDPWMSMKPQYNFSCFFWVKGTTSGWLFAHNAWEFRLRPDFIQVHVGPSGEYAARYTGTFDTNTWYHLGFTWSGMEGKLRLYLNGNLVATSDVPSSVSYDASSSFKIPYDGPRYINDFRLYDHCLSNKEVKEISKGLICHYKLDNNGFGGENLILESHKVVSGANASGITSTYMNDGSLKVVATPGNGSWRSCGFSKDSNSNVGNKLSVGDTYTISLDVKIEEGNSLPSLFINNGNPYRALQPVNGKIVTNNWFRAYYTSTWNEPGTSYGNISIHLSFGGITGTFYFKNFKLEKGSKPTQWCPSPLDDNTLGLNSTTEDDCSGYKNNGDKIGNILPLSESCRYSTSTYCNSTNIGTNTPTGAAFIRCTLVNPIINATALTINWWGNIEDYSYQDSGILSLSNSSSYPSDYENSALAQYDSIFRFNLTDGNNSSIGSLALIETGNWHMYTLVFNNGTVLGYRDGVSIVSNSKSGTLAQFTYVYMGINMAGGVYRQTKSKWSDFRIYSTALSASDIKELYNISASVDKNGNMYAYEFKEE